MELNKDWQPYDGVYQKKMQDVRLKNGDILTMCWPNAGFWNTCDKESQYYHKDVKHDEAESVRLTHSERW